MNYGEKPITQTTPSIPKPLPAKVAGEMIKQKVDLEKALTTAKQFYLDNPDKNDAQADATFRLFNYAEGEYASSEAMCYLAEIFDPNKKLNHKGTMKANKERADSYYAKAKKSWCILSTLIVLMCCCVCQRIYLMISKFCWERKCLNFYYQ